MLGADRAVRRHLDRGELGVDALELGGPVLQGADDREALLELRRRGHGSREALEGDAGPGSLGLAGVLRVAGEDRLERLPEAPQA